MIGAASAAAVQRGLALEAAQPDAAFACFLEATQLDPGNGRAWRQLGNLLRRAGRLAEASACFEQALAAGDDPSLNRFFLSAVGVGAVAGVAPPAFVSALFDQYADRFDAHLMGELHCRAPDRLAALLAEAGGRAFAAVLDLGCGTGLMGKALNGCAARLVGVDLSARMLSRAAETDLYDTLVHDALEHHLQTTADRFDLVVCCEVFIYIGDLETAFAGVRRVLHAGGSFLFSVESSDAASGVDLLPSLRFAHSEAYIRRLAGRHGFELRGIVAEALRDEAGQPVQGLYVHLAGPCHPATDPTT